MCLWSIQSHVGKSGEGVRTRDWTHSCGKDDLAWSGLTDPSRCSYHTSLFMCVGSGGVFHISECEICG